MAVAFLLTQRYALSHPRANFILSLLSLNLAGFDLPGVELYNLVSLVFHFYPLLSRCYFSLPCLSFRLGTNSLDHTISQLGLRAYTISRPTTK